MTTRLPALRPPQRSGLRWFHVLGIVLVTIVGTAAGTTWLVSGYLFPRDFEPVSLSPAEGQTLERKLRTLGLSPERSPAPSGTLEAGAALAPEPYRETDTNREVVLSERELNALLAKNTELAQKLAIDLSDNLVSGKLLVPLEEDLPVLGGRTLRVHVGLEVSYTDARPVVAVKGVSLMGVPLPNAWLGGLKNVDLVKEFGAEPGFWKAFADGVESLRVEEGRLKIRLKE
ncbi:MAG: hypothetical protein P1P84_17170 [Deferrisomatales bacterium]|nr:hypothetical protein [Deferrisomatales bacterium]